MSSRWLGGFFVAALGVYALESMPWPMRGGRDASTYLQYYLELWHPEAIHPELMLFRTPVTPLVVGSLFDLGGPVLLEAGFAVLFAASVAALGAAAGRISFGLGVASVAAVLAYPSNGALFHQFSSDPVTGAVVALLVVTAVYAVRRRSSARFAFLGVLVACFSLVRPVNQLLLLLVALPLVTADSWRRRLLRAGAFLGSASAFLTGWALHNYVRYDDFTVARTGAAQIPLARVFVTDGIVSPDNGSISRQLGHHVRRYLLAEEPYRSYGITEERFYSPGSWRMYYDLLYVSNQAWGWHSDYANLRRVGLEAIRAHPRLYLRGGAQTIWDELTLPYEMRSVPPAAVAGESAGRPETIVVNGRRLPKPSEGEPIPGQLLHWLLATPDNRIWIDWSDVANPVVRYRDPKTQAAAETLRHRLGSWERRIPNRSGADWISQRLNSLNARLPPMVFWLVLGLPSVLLWRLPEVRALILVTVGSALVIFVTALGVPPALEFALPFQPLFTVFGLTGILAVVRLAPLKSGRGIR